MEDVYKVVVTMKGYKTHAGETTELDITGGNLYWDHLSYDDFVQLEMLLPKLMEGLTNLGQEKAKEKKQKKNHD